MVSVVMPVFNGQDTLHEAIQSILDQSFDDFEFIIINDGSTDNSESLIRGYADPRIKCESNKKNLGIVHSLNLGLDLAVGKYIARMDCDDISHPKRLEKQVRLMESDDTIGVCGSWVKYFDAISRIVRLPKTHEEIKATLFFETPMAHPATLFRRSIISEYHIRFKSGYERCEDYKFWSDLIFHTKFANIQEALLFYRIRGTAQFSVSSPDSQKIRNEMATNLLGRDLNKREATTHAVLNGVKLNDHIVGLDDIESWIAQMLKANSRKRLYETSLLRKLLKKKLKDFCIEKINFCTNRAALIPKNFQELKAKINYTKRIDMISLIKLLVKYLFMGRKPTETKIY